MITTRPRPKWAQTPLETRRRPGLGHYSGTRQEWKKAWREARTHHKDSRTSTAHKVGGLLWKACLVLWGERDSDQFWFTPAQQRESNRVIDEILQAAVDRERRTRV